TTTSLMRDHAQPPVLVDGVRLLAERVADPTLFTRAYRARSEVLVGGPEQFLGRSSTGGAWPLPVRNAYLELPPDPRYRMLAQEALSSLRPEYRDDPWGQALGVALWLEQNTRYSLRSQHASASDPTGSFLFGSRIGYCVHLAHAAAYMMRALGLPSRVAAGYAYPAADRAGGSAILLRGGDAHAWAEVYLDGVGWVAVDPSPATLDPPLPAPDLDLQRLLGELARPEDGRTALQLAEGRRPEAPGRLIAIALLAGALAWAASGFLLKAYRRSAPWLARRDASGRVAYRASLDRLAEAGLHRDHGETREAFAERSRSLSPAFGRLTREHLAARFGNARADPREARDLASTVAREIATRAGWRRWLGLASPWSWTRAR
ncbi:MAG: transglutaminase domain-containing protein, partial [Acidobacteriota bacterium]|nr:transglutaminase domain-containing protein [Acidobacteriota bacterium]